MLHRSCPPGKSHREARVCTSKLIREVRPKSIAPSLSQALFGSVYPTLSSEGLRLFNWRSIVLISLSPRIPRRVGRRPDFVVYTDESTSSLRIAGLSAHKLKGALTSFGYVWRQFPKIGETTFTAAT